MKRIFLFSLLFVMQAAFAAKTVTFSGGVINVGDTADKVLKVAGTPRNKDAVEGYKGGAAERWYYDVDDKTVTLVIQGGKVISIPEVQS